MAAAAWKEGLWAIVPSGYFAGVVDNVEEFLEKHKVETQACFGTKSSVKREIKIGKVLLL